MNYSNYTLNKQQLEIVVKIKDIVKEELDVWLSTPHRSFKNKPPIEMLLTENYDYFYSFLTSVK